MHSACYFTHTVTMSRNVIWYSVLEWNVFFTYEVQCSKVLSSTFRPTVQPQMLHTFRMISRLLLSIAVQFNATCFTLSIGRGKLQQASLFCTELYKSFINSLLLLSQSKLVETFGLMFRAEIGLFRVSDKNEEMLVSTLSDFKNHKISKITGI